MEHLVIYILIFISRRKTTVQSVAVYTDYKLDESYTPTRISIRVGTNFNDLQEIEVVELQEPTGWVEIPLKDMNEKLVRTFLLQVAVIQNHQQGRDTHLRQVKVFSPVVTKSVTTEELPAFTSIEMRQHMFVR